MSLFHRYDLKKGIFFVILGWLSFSTMYMISKLIGEQTSIPTMLFFRNVLGFVGVLPWVIKEWPKSLKIFNFKIVLIRSITGLLNIFLIFLAVEKISLVNTVLLNNSAPFFVPFIVWFFLKKTINNKIWPAIVVGFIGIALILEPNRQILNWGSFYALLSGICLAITLITMRLSTKIEKLSSLLLYFFAIGLIITTPFALFDWKIEGWTTLIALLCIGLFSALGQILLFQGLKYGKAHQLAPFTYSAVIFSGIYEWIIWEQTPALIAYLGTILIIAAGVWIVWISRTPKNL